MNLRRNERNTLVVDVGSTNTVLATPRRAHPLRESTLVACSFSKALLARTVSPRFSEGQPVALGSAVSVLHGGKANLVRVFTPVERGHLVDPDAMEHLVRGVARQAGLSTLFTRVFGGSLGIRIPLHLSEQEQAVYRERLEAAGLGKARLIQAPVAAAWGSGLDITGPEGRMLIDIGGGTLCVTTFALGGVVSWTWNPIGGKDFDQALVRYVERRYRIRLSAGAAEQVKCAIGSVYPKRQPESLEIVGADLASGIEKKVSLDDNDIRDVLIDACEPLVMAIQQGFETVPPELASDIARSEIVLVGGGALLQGLPALLAERTGLVFRLAEDPLNAGVGGALQLMR